MAYSIEADFRIRGFSEAESKYNSVTPIRGNTNDIRPLGRRNAQHMRIVKIDDDTYACKLYGTDVATFHRDGRIVYSTGGWDTTSTGNFMSACAPYGWWASKVHNRVQLHNRQTSMWYIVANATTINISTDEITGYIPPTKQVVDRVATKEKRAPYRPFLDFIKTYMVTLNMPVPRIKEQYWDNVELKDKFIDDVTSVPEEMWLDVLAGMVYQSAWSNSQRNHAQVVSQMTKVTAVYKTVALPIGSLQK
jgi:hypothetical protein